MSTKTNTAVQNQGANAVSAGTTPVPRIILASLIGTSIEFYDFYIYATAAVSVFPVLFFGGDRNSLLASLGSFGVAFIARPVGAVLFGHYGDRIGRKATLVGSLLTMGLATFSIGLLPTELQIGIWAPLMLTILRFTQGLGLGGEWSGAALLATENAPPNRRARAGMWPQLGAPIGFTLANGAFLVLIQIFGYNSVTDGHTGPFMAWGWRIPFIISILLVALGLYVRIRLEETPVFSQAVKRGEKVGAPLRETFRTSRKQVILGTAIMVVTYAHFYLMTAWITSYASGNPETSTLKIPTAEFPKIQLAAVLFFAAGIPLAAWITDKYGRRTPLILSAAAIGIFGLSFGFFLDPERIGAADSVDIGLLSSFLCLGMALMGFNFGPMSALLPELFPTNVRYTGSGLAYNISSILGAAVAPFAAVWINRQWGVAAVGYYLAAMALLSVVALFAAKETKDADLNKVKPDKLRRSCNRKVMCYYN